MIVIPTIPKKSRYIILNNADSTILTTPISISQPEVVEVLCVNIKELKVATHSAYSHFLCIILYNIFTRKQANIIKFYNFLFFQLCLTPPKKDVII